MKTKPWRPANPSSQYLNDIAWLKAFSQFRGNGSKKFDKMAIEAANEAAGETRLCYRLVNIK